MNRLACRLGDYSAQREAERFVGHCVFLAAVLGVDDDPCRAAKRLRLRRRPRSEAVEHGAEAVAVV